MATPTTPKYVYFKGGFVPYNEAKVGVLTHALNYGTGCFEGIRAYWNDKAQELFLLQMAAHYERLKHSASVLFNELSMSVEELSQITVELVRKNEYREDVYVRPLFYMSDEIIGVKLHDLHPDLAISAVPLGDYVSTTGLNVCVSSWRRIDDNAVPARAKLIGAYINSAFAKTEAVKNGFDEAIFLNPDGHVSEGSAMNLFIVRGRQLVTPQVNHNILEGVTRQCVMDIAAADMDIDIVERSIDRTELYICDEIFLCGTGAQIAPVVRVDHRSVGDGKVGPVTRRIKEVYHRAARGMDDRFKDWVTPVYSGSK